MLIIHDLFQFLPRDATQSAVLLRQVVCPSVCPLRILTTYSVSQKNPP